MSNEREWRQEVQKLNWEVKEENNQLQTQLEGLEDMNMCLAEENKCLVEEKKTLSISLTEKVLALENEVAENAEKAAHADKAIQQMSLLREHLTTE